MKKLVTSSREFYKPFSYPEAYEFYERSEKMHWTADEVPMHQDVLDWVNKLTISQKKYFTNVFRFFTQADVDISGAYIDKYFPIFKQPEIRMMLLSFACRETVHIKAYSHLIDTLGMPESTYKDFFEYEEMKNKHLEFQKVLVGKWEDNIEMNTAYQMAVFSGLVEGMQLFSSFIMLLNPSRFNLMNGMGQIISWSIKDEALHCEGLSWLFRQYVKEHRHIWTDELKSAIYTTATEFIHLEDLFIDLSFGEEETHQNLTKSDLKLYCRLIADRRLITLGLKGIFKVKENPLPWVEEMLNAPEHTSFFEQKPTNYTKSALKGSWENVWVKSNA